MLAPVRLGSIWFHTKPGKERPEVYTQDELNEAEGRFNRDIVTIIADNSRKHKTFLAISPHPTQPQDNALVCFTDDKEGPHATIAETFWKEQPAGQIDERQGRPFFFPAQIDRIQSGVPSWIDEIEQFLRDQ